MLVFTKRRSISVNRKYMRSFYHATRACYLETCASYFLTNRCFRGKFVISGINISEKRQHKVSEILNLTRSSYNCCKWLKGTARPKYYTVPALIFLYQSRIRTGQNYEFQELVDVSCHFNLQLTESVEKV